MEDKMERTIKGKKVKMSQIFMENGNVVPVTILKTEEVLDKDLVDKPIVVVGKSKGKGFAGSMKKWNFKGGTRTRGQSDKPRAPGSIGAQTPGRVYKGKKMAGRMGSKRVTVKGLRIVDVLSETREFLVSGPVPGSRNSVVNIKVIE